jgi:hypothetical protein
VHRKQSVFQSSPPHRSVLATLAVGGIVLISRLAFIGPGLGMDYDAWLLADAARTIRETGQYVGSRPPGYPVVEGLFALLHDLGPWALCAATAVASAVACVLTMRLMRTADCSSAWATSLCFAFTPVVWLSSVTAMDYIWAWCLVMASWTALAEERPVRSGIYLGLAIGARATSGLMVLPLLWLATRRKNSRKFALACTAMASLLYAPVLQQEGFTWMASFSPGGRGLMDMLRLGVVEVWGPIGIAALGVAAIVVSRRIRNRGNNPQQLQRELMATARMGAFLNLVLFLWMPLEAGYLLPFAGCVLILMGAWAPAGVMGPLAAALLVSGVYSPGSKGALLADLDQRREQEILLDLVEEALVDIKEPTVVLCGSMFSMVQYRMKGRETEWVRLRMAMANRDQLLEVKAEGGEQYLFINTIDPWHRANLGYSLWQVARPLLPEDWREAKQGPK